MKKGGNIAALFFVALFYRAEHYSALLSVFLLSHVEVCTGLCPRLATKNKEQRTKTDIEHRVVIACRTIRQPSGSPETTRLLTMGDPEVGLRALYPTLAVVVITPQ